MSPDYSQNCMTSGVAPQVMELSRLMVKRRKTPVEYWRAVKMSKQLVKRAVISEVEIGPDRRPHATVQINGVAITGLLDSGASISCLGKDAFDTIRRCTLKWKEFSDQSAVETASGQQQKIMGYADADVQFQGKTKRIRIYIIPTLKNELYLGIDFWYSFDLLPKLDELSTAVTDKAEIGVEVDPPDVHKLSMEQNQRLNEIIALYPSSSNEGLGKTTLMKHSINTADALPCKQRFRPVSPAVEGRMFAEVDRMISLGVVEESNSAWSSPMSLVPKAGGKWRLCLDARQLNAVTVKDAYPMPNIDSIFSRLHETRFISSVDLKDAYWQIELDDTSREKTAFTIPGRPLYQFTRMPFGLCNASQSMCRLMDQVIPSVLRESVFVYIDDLLVVSEKLDTHLERLVVVAQCLRRANLTINVEKSRFCMRSLKYLGHIIGNGEIKADPGRVQCIVDFPPPNTVKQVRRFMGMTGWYQRYIHNYAATASPITDLLKKTDRFRWTPEAQIAFESLKTSLTTAPVLIHPDFSQHFYIQCDASITGIGGVLFQLIEGEEHPIAFMSKKLNTAQKNYSVTELECLAALLCIHKFRCYVEGMPFTVITDHASLKWLMNQKDLGGRLARWSLSLQSFDFDIVHRKGSANVVPDALSRVEIEELHLMVGTPVDLSSPDFRSENYERLKTEMREHASELPDIQVRGEVIYKRMEFRRGDDVVDSATMWKIWIPEPMRQQIIANAHNPPSASHGGVDKTMELVRRYHYWPGLSREVREFVASCDVCKETKATNRTLRPPMGKAFPTERPFQRMFVDLLGPYPRSKSGHTSILIVLDQLTKFVWLRPLRKATANAIVQYLESEVFHFVGAPETLLSDNGVQFVSKEFKALMSRYGIRQIYAASHSPQANASERVNRTIIAAIRAYVDGDQTTWDVHLSAIASAIRNGAHSSAGQSPYFIVFGQHMVQHAASYPILRILQSLPSGDLEIIPPTEFREALNIQVRNNLQEARDRNERTYNTRSREITFQPGQEVFIRNFRQSDAAMKYNAKLGRQWTPARIVRKVGTCVYEVADRAGKVLRVSYHAKDIRV